MQHKEFEKKFLLRFFNGNPHISPHFKDSLNTSLDQLEQRVIQEGDFLEQFYLPQELVRPLLQEFFPTLNYDEFPFGRIRSKRGEEISYVIEFKGIGNQSRNESPEGELTFRRYSDLRDMSNLGLSKYRLVVPYLGHRVEVDVFRGNNHPDLNRLMLAEIEVNSERKLKRIPPVGLDVSSNKEFGNFFLASMNNQ